jgi:hypothetical protein
LENEKIWRAESMAVPVEGAALRRAITARRWSFHGFGGANLHGRFGKMIEKSSSFLRGFGRPPCARKSILLRISAPDGAYGPAQRRPLDRKLSESTKTGVGKDSFLARPHF